MYTISAFILCAMAGLAMAYPSGAPVETCKTFSANHTDKDGHMHLPQQTISKYEILVAPTSVSSGQSISVTIQGVGEMFKGFFIQGQDGQGNPIGKFQVGSAAAQTRDCIKEGSADAATHIDRDDKSTVTLQWQAPAGYTGTVNFRAVVLKSYAIFWNNLVSSAVTVV